MKIMQIGLVKETLNKMTKSRYSDIQHNAILQPHLTLKTVLVAYSTHSMSMCFHLQHYMYLCCIALTWAMLSTWVYTDTFKMKLGYRHAVHSFLGYYTCRY